MTTGQLIAAPVLRVYDNSGDLAIAGSIYTYLAGTSIPLTTYADAILATPNTNPIILNSRGECSIWVLPVVSYKLVAYDASGNLLWTKDQMQGTGLISAVTNSIGALRNISKVNYSLVNVNGYYSAGDGGGGVYYYDPADTSSADNGGTIIVAADGGRWFLTNIKSVSFEQFGARGDGSTDDTTYIQKCITAVGGIYPIVTPMNKNYKITSTITFGNGTTSAPSTVHGISIKGAGSGITTSEFGGGYSNTIFTWAGAVSGIMFKLNGPIFGVNLEGFTLDCAGIAATGIQSNHLCNSLWQNLLVERYIGPAYQWFAYSTPTGCVVGASGSTFINTSAKRAGTNGNGADFGQSTGSVGNLDVARNTWINCEFWRDSTSVISYSAKFQFIDNCSFHECTLSPGGGSGVSMLIIPPTGVGVTGFPAAISFYNCPIVGPGVAADATWAANEGFQFWPYPVGDGETIPVTPIYGQCYGVTTKNEYFGGIKIGVANPVIKQHLSVTGALTFGAVAATSYQDQAINVPGCLLGDTVIVNCALNSAYAGGLTFSGHVSANGTVIVRCSNCTASSQTPTAGATYRVDVWQH